MVLDCTPYGRVLSSSRRIFQSSRRTRNPVADFVHSAPKIITPLVSVVLMGTYVFQNGYSVSLCLAVGGFTAMLSIVGRYTHRHARDSQLQMEVGRRFAGLAVIALMFFVGLTGNYGFFNLLTIGLALICFTDQDLARVTPLTFATDTRPQPAITRHRRVGFCSP